MTYEVKFATHSIYLREVSSVFMEPEHVTFWSGRKLVYMARKVDVVSIETLDLIPTTTLFDSKKVGGE